MLNERLAFLEKSIEAIIKQSRKAKAYTCKQSKYTSTSKIEKTHKNYGQSFGNHDNRQKYINTQRITKFDGTHQTFRWKIILNNTEQTITTI